jgi:hypothetical protein
MEATNILGSKRLCKLKKNNNRLNKKQMAFKMKNKAAMQMAKMAGDNRVAMKMKKEASMKMKKEAMKMKDPMDMKKDPMTMKKEAMKMKDKEAMKLKKEPMAMKKEAMKMKKEGAMQMKKEMVSAMKKMPDFPDVDEDGDLNEDIKKAQKDLQAKKDEIPRPKKDKKPSKRLSKGKDASRLLPG